MVVFMSSSLVLPPLYTRRVRKERGDEGSGSGKLLSAQVISFKRTETLKFIFPTNT